MPVRRNLTDDQRKVFQEATEMVEEAVQQARARIAEAGIDLPELGVYCHSCACDNFTPSDSSRPMGGPCATYVVQDQRKCGHSWFRHDVW